MSSLCYVSAPVRAWLSPSDTDPTPPILANRCACCEGRNVVSACGSGNRWHARRRDVLSTGGEPMGTDGAHAGLVAGAQPDPAVDRPRPGALGARGAPGSRRARAGARDLGHRAAGHHQVSGRAAGAGTRCGAMEARRAGRSPRASPPRHPSP